MKTLAGGTTTAIESGSVAIVQLVKMEFDSGTIALNTSNWNLLLNGITYMGAYGLGTVSPVNDKPGEVAGLQFSLAGGDSSRISLALDASAEVQGTPITVITAIISTSTYAILEAVTEWTGKADTMSISEDGNTATVGLSAESSAVDLLRGNPSTYTDADQQALFSGDLAFAYVVSQADKPVIWPSREYFYR